MNEPTILDANGIQLSVGMRVVTPSHAPGEPDGEVIEIAWMPEYGWRVVTRWPNEPGDPYVEWATRFGADPNTFTCSDLKAVLTPDPKGAADAS